MHRFFIDEKNSKDEIVTICNKDYKHISKSLRLETGDKIIACTGDGYDLIVELRDFSKNEVKGKILERKKSDTEPQADITIAQAIPKSRNMELIVQKTTEIGVNRIIPLSTKRTIVKLKGKKKKKRINRWQRIAEEAAKQSQRGIIPEVSDIFTLRSLKTIKDDFDLIVALWASEKQKSISSLLNNYNFKKGKRVLVIIGPEGGFSENEINLIEDELNGIPVSLGPRILRTETAPIVALSTVLYEFGDLGG